MIASLSPSSPFTAVRQERPEASPASRDTATDGSATSRAEADSKSEHGKPGIPSRGQGDGQLSEADLQKVQALQQRDREVRAHEMAHVAAGGSLVRGGASFTYEFGRTGNVMQLGVKSGLTLRPDAHPPKLWPGPIRSGPPRWPPPTPQGRTGRSPPWLRAWRCRPAWNWQPRTASVPASTTYPAHQASRRWPPIPMSPRVRNRRGQPLIFSPEFCHPAWINASGLPRPIDRSQPS
jgi:hypothetical protein